MVYRAIGLMSGSSLDGLDIAYVQFNKTGGRWNFEILHASCSPYPAEWKQKLQSATLLNALDYQLLDVEYGHYLAEKVNEFIGRHNLHYQVQLIASHGHTSFHMPQRKMTAQLGDGAAIAAGTGINVVSDLRAMDLACGGQGAPIVPIGEKWLFEGHDFFLNIGGIANLTYKNGEIFTGFDICPANRVLNMLAQREGKEYDVNGEWASEGQLHPPLLNTLNHLPYYEAPYPKSLANDFGTATVYPLLLQSGLSNRDTLRTYVEHIAIQLKKSLTPFCNHSPETVPKRMLVTGGGALNGFLMERLKENLTGLGIVLEIPDEQIIQYKEALIMAFIGVLRWREENNVLASVTGAARSSIGGAVWIGQEA